MMICDHATLFASFSADMDKCGIQYIINHWIVEPACHRLKHRQMKAVRSLNAHGLRLLQILAEHPGETLPAYFLIQGAWQGKPVGINSLRVAIRALRVALDDDQKPQTVILTVPGKGYQLNPDCLVILPDRDLQPAEPTIATRPSLCVSSPEPVPLPAAIPVRMTEACEGSAVSGPRSRWRYTWLVLVPLALTALYFLGGR